MNINKINYIAISLVAGGAGFLGTNLCIKLLDMGHFVICIDNLYTGKMQNIKELINNNNFIFIKEDICKINIKLYKEKFNKIDYIWHLACPASPPKYQQNGYKTLKTCLIGTMNILKLTKYYNSKLLFTSTSEVYGDALITPQTESYWGNVNPIGPRSCYDEGKRCAETLIYEYRKKNPTMINNLKIVRIFNTYGPYMDIDDGRVITNFIKSIINKNPIIIYGDGYQTRSFCYVSDMINGFILMMNSEYNGPINIGNPYTEFTILELKKIFDKLLNKQHSIKFIEETIDDPKQRCPNIQLAIDKLNWRPEINI